MSSFSINTNVGSMVAMQNLRDISTEKQGISKKIQTGKKVADAFDDPGVFGEAQKIRGTVKAFGAVQQSLSFAEGLGDVTNAALKNISNGITEIRAKMTQLADGSISTAQRTTYTSDLTKLREQVGNYITQANYNGTNMIKSGGASKNFLADTVGTTMAMTYTDVDALKTTFDTALDVSSAATATTSLAALDTFEQGVLNAMSSVASDVRGLKAQNSFINEIVAATKKGLGALVDADLAQESANLNAAQVREQLAMQALGIANSEPQGLLSLFR